MQISYSGLEALKKEEEFRSTAYTDTGGVWTIGYGTTRVDGKPVLPGMVCTEALAAEWLRVDCAAAQTAVNQLVKLPLNQQQFDALVSFVYNVGVTAFQKSTMLRMLNMGLYKEAAAQFDRWIYDEGKRIEGLVNRRKRERKMFES